MFVLCRVISAMTTTADIIRAASLIDQADLLLVAAGAGMGVDSGLPDFRGNEGFWKAYPALARAQLAFASVASPRTFEDDAALAKRSGRRTGLCRRSIRRPAA